MKDELLSICILAPLFSCDFTGPILPEVFATDATTEVGAVT